MPKVTHTGDNHGDAGSVRRSNNLSVADRAAGLNDRRDPGSDRRFDRVGERKKASEASTEPTVGDCDSPAARAISAARAAAIFTASTRFI